MPYWLGTVLGLVVSFVLVAVLETVSHVVFPPPPGVNLNDPGTLARIMDEIPLGAKVAVLVAWAAGTLVGSWVAVRWTPGRPWWPALVVGGVFLACASLTLVQIPHPLWMNVVGLAEFLPFALLGGWLARRPATQLTTAA